jgi:hypothetical protein
VDVQRHSQQASLLEERSSADCRAQISALLENGRKSEKRKKRILVDDFARYPKTRKWVTIPALGYEAEQPQKSVLDLSDKFLVA